jgi:putative flavoprotein involved in K+ transport
MPDVIVVGAGPAGLSTAGALRRLGVGSVVLEKDAEIGARWASRYERLRLHTVRRFSGLVHHPIPNRFPRYVPKDDFADYLREYAARYELDVRVGSDVTRVREEPPGWSVETARDEAWRAPVVVIATGKYDRPVIPDWPGREAYCGRLIHSTDYRSAEEYRGRDVLVVGLGNTGAEIAADLAESGAGRVAVAIRTPPPITRRDVAGVPIQVLGIAGSILPASVGDRLGSALRRVGTGDLSRYGIGKAAWGPFQAKRPPVIDVGFLAQLKAGRIEILSAVERLTTEGVVLADSREERFDIVIAATGFRTSLPDLLDDGRLDPAAAASDGLPPGLHLVGFRESIRGGLFEIRHESRRVARAIARSLGVIF